MTDLLNIIVETLTELLLLFIGTILFNISLFILSNNWIHISFIADICIVIGVYVVIVFARYLKEGIKE